MSQGRGWREASLRTYSPQLGIYGPRRPLIAVLTFPASNKEPETSSTFLPGRPFLSISEASRNYHVKEIVACVPLHLWRFGAGLKKKLLIPDPRG